MPAEAPSTRAPCVSILMAVRDGDAFLPAAINSLLAQDMADFELVIVDDASSEPARALLADYAATDNRILLLRNAEQRGIPASLNLGLRHCSAPLTARADGDDVYLPHRLSRQVAYMQTHSEVGILSCGWYRVSDDCWSDKSARIVSDPAQIRFDRLFVNRLLHSGVMFRTDLVRAAGGYDPRYWTAQDSELWSRLSPRTSLANLDEPLLGYRVHLNSMMRKRGLDGVELSLSVPARELGTYLGAALQQDKVNAAARLYRGEVMDPIEARRAHRVMRRVHACALQRESAHVVATFERRVSDALLYVARSYASAQPAGALPLACKALAWRFNKRWLRRVASRVLMRAPIPNRKVRRFPRRQSGTAR